MSQLKKMTRIFSLNSFGQKTNMLQMETVLHHCGLRSHADNNRLLTNIEEVSLQADSNRGEGGMFHFDDMKSFIPRENEETVGSAIEDENDVYIHVLTADSLQGTNFVAVKRQNGQFPTVRALRNVYASCQRTVELNAFLNVHCQKVFDKHVKTCVRQLLEGGITWSFMVELFSNRPISAQHNTNDKRVECFWKIWAEFFINYDKTSVDWITLVQCEKPNIVISNFLLTCALENCFMEWESKYPCREFGLFPFMFHLGSGYIEPYMNQRTIGDSLRLQTIFREYGLPVRGLAHHTLESELNVSCEVLHLSEGVRRSFGPYRCAYLSPDMNIMPGQYFRTNVVLHLGSQYLKCMQEFYRYDSILASHVRLELPWFNDDRLNDPTCKKRLEDLLHFVDRGQFVLFKTDIKTWSVEKMSPCDSLLRAVASHEIVTSHYNVPLNVGADNMTYYIFVGSRKASVQHTDEKQADPLQVRENARIGHAIVPTSLRGSSGDLNMPLAARTQKCVARWILDKIIACGEENTFYIYWVGLAYGEELDYLFEFLKENSAVRVHILAIERDEDYFKSGNEILQSKWFCTQVTYVHADATNLSATHSFAHRANCLLYTFVPGPSVNVIMFENAMRLEIPCVLTWKQNIEGSDAGQRWLPVPREGIHALFNGAVGNKTVGSMVEVNMKLLDVAEFAVTKEVLWRDFILSDMYDIVQKCLQRRNIGSFCLKENTLRTHKHGNRNEEIRLSFCSDPLTCFRTAAHALSQFFPDYVRHVDNYCTSVRESARTNKITMWMIGRQLLDAQECTRRMKQMSTAGCFLFTPV